MDEQLPPAHVPRESWAKGIRPALVNVDGTGLSMSWQTAGWIVAGIAVAISTAYATAQSLVFTADLDSHDASQKAHPVQLERGADTVPTAEVLKKHEHQLRDLPRLIEQQGKQATKLDDILRSMYEERAETLADAAVEGLTKRKRKGVWDHVRATAIANQYAGRPIRSELQQYFAK